MFLHIIFNLYRLNRYIDYPNEISQKIHNNKFIFAFTFKFGKQSRMWCIRSLLSVFVKYGVPFRLANEGYFLCKKYDSSLRALAMD